MTCSFGKPSARACASNLRTPSASASFSPAGFGCWTMARIRGAELRSGEAAETSGLRLALISASSASGASLPPPGSIRGALPCGAARPAPPGAPPGAPGAAPSCAPRPAPGLITVRSDSKAAKGSFSRPVSLMSVPEIRSPRSSEERYEDARSQPRMAQNSSSRPGNSPWMCIARPPEASSCFHSSLLRVSSSK